MAQNSKIWEVKKISNFLTSQKFPLNDPALIGRRYVDANGFGRMVIGRSYVNSDEEYASVVVDELLLWNRKLTQPEIMKIVTWNE